MQSRREGERRRSSAVAVGPSRRRSSAVPMNYTVRCGAQAVWRYVSKPLYFLPQGGDAVSNGEDVEALTAGVSSGGLDLSMHFEHFAIDWCENTGTACFVVA